MHRIINWAMFTALSLTASLVLFEEVIRPTIIQSILDNFAAATAALQTVVR